jgi:hypothetical protein
MQLDARGLVLRILSWKVKPAILSLRIIRVGDFYFVVHCHNWCISGASSLALEYKTLLQRTCVKLAEAWPKVIQVRHLFVYRVSDSQLVSSCRKNINNF